MDSLVRLFGGHIYTSPRGGRLNAAIVRVMQAVARHLDWSDAARQDGGCWPGQQRIASDCCISERTVRRAMKQAAALNLIRYVEAGAGRPNRTFFNPGLLAAARQLDSLPWAQQRQFAIDLSELPSWGEPRPAEPTSTISRMTSVQAGDKDLAIELGANMSGMNFIADTSAINVIADKLSGESFSSHRPPALTVGASAVFPSPVAEGRGRGGGGSLSFEPDAQGKNGSATNSMSLGATGVRLDDAALAKLLREAGLEVFDAFLIDSRVTNFRLEFQRRRKDGTRGGIIPSMTTCPDNASDIERRLIFALRAPEAKTTDRFEILCSSQQLLMVDDVHVNRVREFCEASGFRSIVLETSHDNWQALFPVSSELTEEQCRQIQRALMHYFLQFGDGESKGADRNAVGLGQRHRLPGSVNYKNGENGQPIKFMTRVEEVFFGKIIEEQFGPATMPLQSFSPSTKLSGPVVPRSRALAAPDRSASAIDWGWTRRQLEAGRPDWQIQRELEGRALMPGRRARSPAEAASWAARTLSRAKFAGLTRRS